MSYLRRKKVQNLSTAFTANTASQEASTTVLDVSNSEITFTPPAGNFEYVVFEYTIQYHASSNHTLLYYELQEKIGSGTYAQLGSGYRATDQMMYNAMQNTITGRFFIPIYSGARSYKMTIRSSATNRKGTLHSTDSGTVYSPIYQMYCV